MRNSLSSIFSLMVIAGLLLNACQAAPTSAPVVSPQPVTPLPNVITPLPPTATATLPAKPVGPVSRTLSICLGQEPASLYLYGSSSRGMWSVLDAVYDGPIDIRKFAAWPVILQKLPSLADQDVVFEPVDVKAGDLVVDVNGNLMALATGSRVFPAGCYGADCVATWDGKKALKMDRLKVTFKLLPGLKWSDGTALTAADSVYSFNLAADPSAKVAKTVVDRTDSYRALDDLTVEWTGRPGYAPQKLEELFFQPLPKHAWEKYKPAELQSNELSTRKPLGWGPYVIEEWQAGNNIRLRKNPNYFRASEGLPKFDTLVFRFLGEPGDDNLAALRSGECDVIDQTTLLEDQLKQITVLQAEQKLKVYIGESTEWEHLDFGIKPASYDDGYQNGKDRPDFFGDVRVRQAFAYCIDRQALVKELLYDRSRVPTGYLPSGHPLLLSDLVALPYDVTTGNRLLTEAGWKDSDNNPVTPRTAQGVANVPNGTPFVINYITTEAALRSRTAEWIAKNLAACGVQVNVSRVNPGQLYAAGPDGVLFGRNFDLAQFSWETGGQSPCFLFESSAIPTSKNNWLGGNLTGYSVAAYDTACQKARQARTGSAETVGANQEVLRLLAKDLPVIPLYFSLRIAIARPDFCNLEIDVSARSLFSNLESFDYGSVCPP